MTSLECGPQPSASPIVFVRPRRPLQPSGRLLKERGKEQVSRAAWALCAGWVHCLMLDIFVRPTARGQIRRCCWFEKADNSGGLLSHSSSFCAFRCFLPQASLFLAAWEVDEELKGSASVGQKAREFLELSPHQSLRCVSRKNSAVWFHRTLRIVSDLSH